MNDHKPFPTNRILSPQERRLRNREEMSDAILMAAREVIHQEGAGALNLHELARRVGLQTSSLYVYFSSKMAIYDALYALGIYKYQEELDRILQTITDPWEALQAVIERAMDFSIRNPELFQICFERPIPGFEPSKESMDETDKLTTAMYTLLNRVMPAYAPGLIRNVPPAHGLFIAMWHGLIALQLANDPGVPVREGRFGRLIPEVMALFKTAWNHPTSSHPLPSVSDR